MDEVGPAYGENDERENDQLRLECDRNDLLRQELELARRDGMIRSSC